jgi:hypothetical protein
MPPPTINVEDEFMKFVGTHYQAGIGKQLRISMFCILYLINT